MTHIAFSLTVSLFSILNLSSSYSDSRLVPNHRNYSESDPLSNKDFFPDLKTDTMNKNIKTMAFYLQDGVEVLDFAGPMEVFAYAGYKIFTVSKTKETIVSQGILKILPDYDITDAPDADVLVFFGGNSGEAFRDKEVISWVRNRKNVKYYFSVCTGAFMLAESGILDGLKATTFHNSLDDLEQGFPKIEVLREVRFVDNGKVITTAGISAGIDGALHMVAKLQGLGQAKRVAYIMEYDNWVPGNGILSGDNPYLNASTENDFVEYLGSYQFLNASSLTIEKGTKGGELTAVINDKKTPLFFEKRDRFYTGDKKYVFFRRDSNHKITGYSLEENGILYKKKP